MNITQEGEEQYKQEDPLYLTWQDVAEMKIHPDWLERGIKNGSIIITNKDEYKTRTNTTKGK